MNLYEHEAKDVLKSYGLPTPQGRLIQSDADISSIQTAGVIKAQIHAGGRGKAGGVVVSQNPQDLKDAAKKLINKPLITAQTPPEGEVVKKLYLEELSSIKEEFYLSFVINRAHETIEMLAAKAGGVHIEDNFDTSGIKILLHNGWQSFYARQLGLLWGVPATLWNSLNNVVQKLYQAFVESDATLLEINPFVLTKENEFILLDAKMTLDDNALFRHPGFVSVSHSDAEEKAKAHDLNYIQLDGSIGCMVNGAGLAMATMDLVAHHGGKPANFLDVGGAATVERIKAAGEILLASPSIKSIFVNIVGGIVRCDILAEGLILALQNHKQQGKVAPTVVVRLQGTKEEEGKELMKKSGLPFVVENDLTEATLKAVQAAA